MNELALDTRSEADARADLMRCCGSTRWVDAMLARRPFGTTTALLAAADAVWARATRDDVLEALTHHPRIGSDLESLRAKFAPDALEWSGQEQASVQTADDATLIALRDGNAAYEARFGYIFVVCATGKSAREMLDLLHARLPNDPADEWRHAAREQAAITRIRLQKLETST